MNMNRISVSAAKLERALQVIQSMIVILLIIVGFTLAACFMVYIHNPEIAVGSAFNVVEIGDIELTLKGAPAPDLEQVLAYAVFAMAAAVADTALLFWGIRCLRRILTAAAEGRPFDPDNAVQLKTMAWLSLADGVFNNLVGWATTRFNLWLFPVKELMASGLFESVEVNYSFPLNFLVFFFLLMVLSRVFAYGAELQRQSDETL